MELKITQNKLDDFGILVTKTRWWPRTTIQFSKLINIRTANSGPYDLACNMNQLRETIVYDIKHTIEIIEVQLYLVVLF